MNPTKTDDREQWRARILRALTELQPEDSSLKAQDRTQRSDGDPDLASSAAAE